MTKILYWIDDTHDNFGPPNSTAQKRLETGLGVTLKALRIDERKEFGNLLSHFNSTKGKDICGIIMDYQLTKLGDNGLRAVGSTWAAEVRAVAPSIAIIGISHEPEKKIPRISLENFLAFYPRDVLGGINPPYADVSALLKGYEAAFHAFTQQNKGKKTGAGMLLDLIAPPAPTRDLVLSIIPGKLAGLWDEGTPHVASRWIWHELQGRPGFLFDDLSLATYLGLNLAGLKRVHPKFAEARYSGAFSSDVRARWWVSSIRGIVEKLVGHPVLGQVSSARCDLLSALKISKGAQSDLFAKAHSHSGFKLIPDCVAYRDDEREEEERVQALFAETNSDPSDANPPAGFESRRIFGPAPQS